VSPKKKTQDSGKSTTASNGKSKALKELTAAEEAEIVTLVKKAVS
jgi:hypothetical protein